MKKNGPPTQVGTLNMENYKIRKIVDVIDDIIDMMTVEKKNGRQVQDTAEKQYKYAEKIGNYTQEELQIFDEEIKDFFQIWVHLHGEKIIIN